MDKEAFLKQAPGLTEAELEEINGLFRAFIFRRHKTSEYWTTCCRKHVLLEKERTQTPEMRSILEIEHAPEPEYVWIYGKYGFWEGSRLKNPHCKDRHTCPHCGREVTVKELGRTGRRQNLTTYRRGVCLKGDGGGVWAICWHAKKSYAANSANAGTEWLTNPPDYTVHAVIRFEPGRITKVSRDWWYSSSEWYGPQVRTAPKQKNLPFPEADVFYNESEYGMGYERIGGAEIGKSPFRWAGIMEIDEHSLLRGLGMACFYPRQMEMLHRFGFDCLIRDYIDKGVKTAWLLDWKTEKPKSFLRLPLKTVLEACGIQSGRQGAVPTAGKDRSKVNDVRDGLEGLRIWKQNGKKDEPEECVRLAKGAWDYKKREFVRRKAKDWGLRIGKLLRYLEENHEKHKSLDDAIQIWKDYLDAAEHLGLDMGNDVIRMPKKLNAAHDERCAEWAALQANQRNAEAMERYRKRYAELTARYEAEISGLRIAVPKDAGEIVTEGKRLKHCVGGYADRHLSGATTILFLRRAEEPATPYVTVEINGNSIRQVHGWDNERTACPLNPKRTPIQKLHKDFFDIWLDWLKKGSPRDKDGKPKIKRKTGPEGAARERKAG